MVPFIGTRAFLYVRLQVCRREMVFLVGQGPYQREYGRAEAYQRDKGQTVIEVIERAAQEWTQGKAAPRGNREIRHVLCPGGRIGFAAYPGEERGPHQPESHEGQKGQGTAQEEGGIEGHQAGEEDKQDDAQQRPA